MFTHPGKVALEEHRAHHRDRVTQDKQRGVTRGLASQPAGLELIQIKAHSPLRRADLPAGAPWTTVMQSNAALTPAAMGPDSPRWHEVLRDRSQVLIRPVRKDDQTAERIFIQTLSPQARRDRFLGQVQDPSTSLIEQLTDIDYVHDVAFAAVLLGLPLDLFVGVARYSATVQGTECECAVTVLDDWQKRGLGTTLMKHLIDVARLNGIKRMWSIDLAENDAMADLACGLGFERELDPNDASQVVHTLWIGEPGSSIAR